MTKDLNSILGSIWSNITYLGVVFDGIINFIDDSILKFRQWLSRHLIIEIFDLEEWLNIIEVPNKSIFEQSGRLFILASQRLIKGISSSLPMNSESFCNVKNSIIQILFPMKQGKRHQKQISIPKVFFDKNKLLKIIHSLRQLFSRTGIT